MNLSVRRLLLTLTAVLALAGAANSYAATVTVTITKGGFSPRDVTIAPGDTVTWTNSDQSAHQVVANGGAFTSPLLATGQSWSYTFTTAGKFNYQDANAKKLRGTVEVAARATASVTLAAARQVVVFGSAVTLSGDVSTKAAGEPVEILAKSYGQSAFTQLGVVTTGTGGSWSVPVKPRIGTTYEARWKGTASKQVAVSVRPRITLALRSGGYFVTRVSPARPGKTALLQRWSVPLRQWITVKKATLDSSSAVRIRWRPRRGDYKVRIFLPQKQAGPGFLAGWSPAKIYVR